MCNSCFDKGYYGFATYNEEAAFDLQLTQKLAAKKLIPTEINDNGIYRVDFAYRCTECNKIWWYSPSENAWRGYFLPPYTAKIYLDELATRNKKLGILGCTIAVIIVALLITAITLAIKNNRR